MSQAQCGSIVVARNGQAVGIWTERDALAIDLADPDIFHTPIAAVMSSPFGASITARPCATWRRASRKTASGITRKPG